MADAIMPDFQLVDGVEVVAVAGRSIENAQYFANRWGIPAAFSLDDLAAANVDADLCYVATTPAHHMTAAMLALDLGMGALVEKAFARSAAEAAPIVAAAAREHRFLMEAMWMRFNPHILAAVEAVADGEIGEPRLLTAAFGRPVPYEPPRWLWDPQQGGGTLFDQAVYPLALADVFFGEPVSVQAWGTTAGYEGDDRGLITEAAVLLGYSDGAQAVSTTSIRAQLVPAAVLSGSEGAIVFDEGFWAANGFTVRSSSGTTRRIDTLRDGNWTPMLRAVRDAYRQGLTEHPLSPMAATLRVTAVLDQVAAQIGGSSARPHVGTSPA
jgi:predicted dehydrogenase